MNDNIKNIEWQPNEIVNDDVFMPITDEEFNLFSTLLLKQFGILIPAHKKNLLVGRLQGTLRRLQLSNFTQYYEHLTTNNQSAATSELANLITTSYSYFYRESAHTELLYQKLLPELTAKLKTEHSRNLRVWSSACASGEEAYTLQIVIMEYLKLDYGNWQAGILATDISANALEKARKGVYSQEQICYTPPDILKRYFTKSKDEKWQVIDKLRSEVTFRRFNLINSQFPFKQPFHFIFCRNVLIYFEEEIRRTLMNKMYDCLEPGGYLFLGHSETMPSNTKPFNYILPSVYQRPD